MIAACVSSAAPGPFPIQEIVVGDVSLTVWVADQSAERRQGLRQVDALPPAIDGMLFAYATATSVTFGMLDTRIPLDIWWFDVDGILVGGTQMQPCPAEPCVSYGSPVPVRWVLETPVGVHDFDPGESLSNVGSS